MEAKITMPKLSSSLFFPKGPLYKVGICSHFYLVEQIHFQDWLGEQKLKQVVSLVKLTIIYRLYADHLGLPSRKYAYIILTNLNLLFLLKTYIVDTR